MFLLLFLGKKIPVLFSLAFVLAASVEERRVTPVKKEKVFLFLIAPARAHLLLL
jgi:hypothetical protein